MPATAVEQYSAINSLGLRDTLPAVECAPWCVAGDGHADAKDVADQQCYGPIGAVALTRESMAHISADEWMLEYVQVYLERPEGSVHTLVNLGKGERPTLHLTLAEAEQLAAALLELVTRWQEHDDHDR